MRQSWPFIALLLAATPAVAQSDPAIALPGVTCAQMTAEGAQPPPLMISAMMGLLAARANRPLISQVQFGVAVAAAQAACTAADGGPRRVLDLLAETPSPEDPAAMDLAAMTCGTLAPLWRQGARVIVPFLAGWLSRPEGQVSRPQMDRLGNGLQSICRDADNAARPVLEVAAAALLIAP